MAGPFPRYFNDIVFILFTFMQRATAAIWAKLRSRNKGNGRDGAGSDANPTAEAIAAIERGFGVSLGQAPCFKRTTRDTLATANANLFIMLGDVGRFDHRGAIRELLERVEELATACAARAEYGGILSGFSVGEMDESCFVRGIERIQCLLHGDRSECACCGYFTVSMLIQDQARLDR